MSGSSAYGSSAANRTYSVEPSQNCSAATSSPARVWTSATHARCRRRSIQPSPGRCLSGAGPSAPRHESRAASAPSRPQSSTRRHAQPSAPTRSRPSSPYTQSPALCSADTGRAGAPAGWATAAALRALLWPPSGPGLRDGEPRVRPSRRNRPRSRRSHSARAEGQTAGEHEADERERRGVELLLGSCVRPLVADEDLRIGRDVVVDDLVAHAVLEDLAGARTIVFLPMQSAVTVHGRGLSSGVFQWRGWLRASARYCRDQR
jgi:hypothetical protein